MADEQIRIDVTAEDDASKVLDKVADQAEQLEKLTPELEVTADTSKADADIKELGQDVEALSRTDTEIVLRARIDDARGQLKAMREDLEATGDQARRTATELDKVGGDPGGGLQTRGNAIADLTGPLGEASGAASDFAGVFDGLGDIAADTAAKMGASQATVGRVASAMGGLGIVVAAGAAAWTLYRQNQEKAAARQKELVEGQRAINDAIKDGNAAAAASKFQELYGDDVILGAKTLGVTIQQMTDYVLGNSDALGVNIAALQAQGGWFKTVGDALAGLRDTYTETNGTIAEQDAVMAALTRAFGANTRETGTNTRAQEAAERQAKRTADAFDEISGALDIQQAALNFRQTMDDTLFWTRSGATLTKQHILDIKQGILDVAEFAGLTPIEVRSYLDRIDNGDVDRVVQEVNHRLQTKSAQVPVELKPPTPAEYAAMNRQLEQGLGTVRFTAILNNLRSGVYG